MHNKFMTNNSYEVSKIDEVLLKMCNLKLKPLVKFCYTCFDLNKSIF